ncbi:MAG: response regulator [Methylicorpusculum sp.]|uniref:response regulator transcription factor n=3 Tax=Methylicorpusculum sp. TaxID=2713644 RepID=UPI0027271AE2|nr:response regulator [Methylicorpusculum sp.]MDO9239964.1 response regulator [Methylicorpusculum sp.]MDP3531433.1 response regulator [Methylicorpusculum sp.]
MNEQTMTVFIIDDDVAVLDSLTLMIEQAELNVQAFHSARAFLDYYHPGMLGCVVLDIKMPEIDGLHLQQKLIELNVPLPVIFLTGHGNIPMSVKAMKSGASDFLTKPVKRDKLMTCIESAFEECKNWHIKQTTRQHAQNLLSTLTDREMEVMKLALDGQANKQIAVELGISHRTVEIHKSRVLQKTGVDNLLELARIVADTAA